MTTIRSIIFDLDDTLFDCTGQLTRAARRRAAEQIRSAAQENSGSVDVEELILLQEDLADTMGSSAALAEIVKRLELPRSVVARVEAAYNRDDVEAIAPFPDVPHSLGQLDDRGYAMVVVTAGRIDRQRAKVERLGLSERFSESGGTLWIHEAATDKTPALRAAADRMGFDPPEVLSVGDKLDADILVSKRLGMVTARLLHGRQKNRAPASDEETPDLTLTRIADLLDHLPPL